MDLTSFYELLTPRGQHALLAAMELQPREKDFLTHFQSLCKQYPHQIAKAALETAILRGEAITKFPQADKMYFTREALEQASGYEVSSYRSERYRGYDHVADLGCSIGSVRGHPETQQNLSHRRRIANGFFELVQSVFVQLHIRLFRWGCMTSTVV